MLTHVLAAAVALCVDAHGAPLIADDTAGRVTRLAPDGTPREAYAPPAPFAPVALACRGGDVVVADRAGKRLVILGADLAPRRTIALDAVPQRVALCPDGALVVAWRPSARGLAGVVLLAPGAGGAPRTLLGTQASAGMASFLDANDHAVACDAAGIVVASRVAPGGTIVLRRFARDGTPRSELRLAADAPPQAAALGVPLPVLEALAAVPGGDLLALSGIEAGAARGDAIEQRRTVRRVRADGTLAARYRLPAPARDLAAAADGQGVIALLDDGRVVSARAP